MNAPSSAGEHIITKLAFDYITHTPRGVDPDRKLQHFRSNRLERGCFIKMASAGWLHSIMKVQLLLRIGGMIQYTPLHLLLISLDMFA